MAKNKILINASNLHVGGGVQVAASFISELYKLQEFNLSVICSQKVYENLPEDINTSKFDSFNVCDVSRSSHLSKQQKELFEGYDLCFTVFGPFYYKFPVLKHICGFAQAWIAYPKNIAYEQLSIKEWLKNKFKFGIQSWYFRHYDALIVEQKHIKKALVNKGIDANNISVVSNCVSSIYEDQVAWSELPFEFDMRNEVTLGFIGRPYAHKNVKILLQVDEILRVKHKMECNFLFTFSESEMNLCGFTEKKNFFSVGEISASQCPAFYQSIDALIFPSLLECFSASPIEAMKMNTTVLASKYPFVEELCKNSAFYFNPLNAENIANTIYSAFSNLQVREEKKKLGINIINNLPTARDRAKSYLKIIGNSL
ncbi:glycosyltransferase [Psychromonas sp. SR45-3]|uniref:glycosyltransferase n=1 Tax=Psychromonas sp. SR45-3 TaxID=2760930 RepID=UPI0015FDC584|nr:glycosyltransferase [Psychromonas sp. SR45-3]MBB1274712.1 glycosyltransferase [Psychromonas sp. SR45-3]